MAYNNDQDSGGLNDSAYTNWAYGDFSSHDTNQTRYFDAVQNPDPNYAYDRHGSQDQRSYSQHNTLTTDGYPQTHYPETQYTDNQGNLPPTDGFPQTHYPETENTDYQGNLPPTDGYPQTLSQDPRQQQGFFTPDDLAQSRAYVNDFLTQNQPSLSFQGDDGGRGNGNDQWDAYRQQLAHWRAAQEEWVATERLRNKVLTAINTKLNAKPSDRRRLKLETDKQLVATAEGEELGALVREYRV